MRSIARGATESERLEDVPNAAEVPGVRIFYLITYVNISQCSPRSIGLRYGSQHRFSSNLVRYPSRRKRNRLPNWFILTVQALHGCCQLRWCLGWCGGGLGRCVPAQHSHPWFIPSEEGGELNSRVNKSKKKPAATATPSMRRKKIRTFD